MKKLIFILMVGICFTQSYEDVIILKDGSEIHGMIIEEKPNEYIKIQSGRNVFVCQMDEIELIKKELIKLTNNIGNDDIRNIYLTLGAGFGTNKNINLAQLSINLGITKNLAFFIAGGLPTLVGGGFSIQKNRSGNGVNFSTGAGFNIASEGLDIVGSLSYQLRIPKSKAFAMFGIMSGVAGLGGYYYDYPLFYLFPVVNIEVRI